MFERDADLLTLPAIRHRAVSQAFLANQLRREIFLARSRVYRLGSPTPLQKLKHPKGFDFYVKREDISPVHSYKWRGAMNRLTSLQQLGCRKVVCASAGNHSQGVAWAAHTLGMVATIFMPSTAQALKIKQTQKQLGSQGKVIITGDCFDDALMEAQKYAEMEQASFIAPFDDVLIMAGQGTVGLEIMQACPNPGTVYLQIGGGGMAAGVACALKHFNPEIRLVGVEAESQASMRAAFDAGCPVELGCVDPFCDGTAVRKVGNMTFAVCKELLDDLITVTNQEVRNAMQFLWNEMRIIPEPSGALGLAALLQQSDAADIKNAVTILSGANMDFSRLSMLAS